MNASTPPAAGWTRRHWVRILGVGLVVHVLLVVWLGERAAPVGVVSSPSIMVRVVGTPFVSSTTAGTGTGMKP